MTAKMASTVNFLGIKVSNLTVDGFIARLLEYTQAGRRKVVTYLNAHCANISFSDPEYKRILTAADIVYADGMSIVWGSRFLRDPLPERINDLDFFDRLCGEIRKRQIGLYLLGGRPGVAELAAERLKIKHPGIRISGTHHGFFSEEEAGAVIDGINASGTGLLIVGMGAPTQEKWVWRYLDSLQVNACWCVGTLEDLAGLFKRAPRWMIDAGLEWLYRFYLEPARLWKRYLIGNPAFIYRLAMFKIKDLIF